MAAGCGVVVSVGEGASWGVGGPGGRMGGPGGELEGRLGWSHQRPPGLSRPVWVAAVACHRVCALREDARGGGLPKPAQPNRLQRAPPALLQQPGQAVRGDGDQEEGVAGGRGEGEDGTPPPRLQTAEPRGNIFHPPKLT